MLNSVTWVDRNKALMVLGNLTENRSAAIMERLQADALPALIEMARWKAPHAYMAFLLIARMAGLDEKEIHNAWDRGERESVIAKANSPGHKEP